MLIVSAILLAPAVVGTSLIADSFDIGIFMVGPTTVATVLVALLTSASGSMLALCAVPIWVAVLVVTLAVAIFLVMMCYIVLCCCS